MSVQFQVVELPSGHHICKVRALNRGDANSEVTVYYQVSWPLAQLSSWLSTFRALEAGGSSDPLTSKALCSFVLGVICFLEATTFKNAPISKMNPF